MDVHIDSYDSVDKVVDTKCRKAGGTALECSDMTKTLGQAREDKKLKPWCEKTFTWFSAKTKPRCTKNCNALLCKDRCKQQDRIYDLRDKISAYDIKMNTAETKEKRMKKVTEDQKTALAKITEHDKTKCTPLTEEVNKIEASQKSSGKELDAAIKAAAKTGAEQEKGFEAMKKLSADKKASQSDKDKATEAYKKAKYASNDNDDKKSKLNKSLKDVSGNLKEASVKQEFQCKVLKEMQSEYDAVNKENEAALKAIATEKKEIKDGKDKAAADKKTLETSLGASLKAI